MNTYDLPRLLQQKTKPLKLTPEEQKEFDETKVCHICGEEVIDDDPTHEMIKVRSHCHFTGKYFGAAHNCCNLK